MICRLCKERLDTEHPDSVFGINPQTFRRGWMHWFCFTVAYEGIEGQDAKSVKYLDRQDEYDDFAQRYPQ